MGDILGYARVSTADQDVAGQSMRLTQAGATKVFTDVRSGRSVDRPGLESLLAYAREGDALAVVRLDRLGRSLGELLATVAMLRARGVALLSLEEKINTASAAGELVFHVFAAIAHFERRLIAERTKDGIAAARARGKRPGRQPLDADKIAAALTLVQAGLSPTAAARQLGLGRSYIGSSAGQASNALRCLPDAPRPSRVRGRFSLGVVYLTADAMTSEGGPPRREGRRLQPDGGARENELAVPPAQPAPAHVAVHRVDHARVDARQRRESLRWRPSQGCSPTLSLVGSMACANLVRGAGVTSGRRQGFLEVVTS